MNYFKDGNMICCVEPNFRNLQEDNAGFGDTRREAFDDFCLSQGEVIKFKHATQSLDINEMARYQELTNRR